MFYQKELLNKKLREATRNQSDAEFVDKMVSNVARILKKDPLRYRYYGLYWWVVKEIMIDHNIEWLDDRLDAEWLEKTRQDSPALSLVAAWLYSEERMNNMEPPTQHGIIDVDGENQEYTLHDDYMERLGGL